jgi:hypothetical protein
MGGSTDGKRAHERCNARGGAVPTDPGGQGSQAGTRMAVAGSIDPQQHVDSLHTTAESSNSIRRLREVSVIHIKESVERVIGHYTENPDDGRGPGVPVTAVMQEGLRCRVETPDGTAIVTDMPTGIGGGGSAPSPGRLFRAALASCDATFVTLRAAQVGIKLTTLEVIVEGDPDDTSNPTHIYSIGRYEKCWESQ